jgi:uncharacterized protein (DUF1697 family)
MLMTKYVALLRGIGPMNPNMRNDKLRGVFEELGFKDVRTVISSGNVVFSSPTTDTDKLEDIIEGAWPKKLGFNSTTIIRSEEQLQQLIDSRPFKELTHTPQTNLTVTFLKRPPKAKPDIRTLSEGRGYELTAIRGHEVCSIVDITSAKTPDLMARLEKEFGKEITTRTWKTVERIIQAMRVK